MPMAFAPLSRRPYSTLVDLPLVATIAAGVGAVIIYTAEIVPATGSAVYVASEQYTTLISDSRPSVPFNGTMAKSPSFKKSIKSGTAFGGISSGFGPLHINNAAGEYDSLISAPLDGARVICKMGWRGISYDRFITIFDGVIESAEINEEEVVLNMKDDNKRLEIPAQPNVYGGTGTTDGDANVKGKRKPLCLGLCPNASAPLIDATYLVYQIHDGQIASVSAVYDRGVALLANSTPNYSNYSNLTAAAITPGRYATCLALGLIRLGAKPDGTITVTVQGAVNNGNVAGSALGATLSDTASLIHYAVNISGANIVVDAASVVAMKTAQGAAIGKWIGPDDSLTLRQLIDELAEGAGGFAGFRADRSFHVGIFTLPVAAVVGDFTDQDWFELKRVALPSSVAIPPMRFFAAYSRNFTQQPEIDATVDAGTQTLRKDEYSIAVSSDTSTTNAIIAAHPTATDSQIIQSWFVNASDAIAECNRRLTLYGGAARSLFRVDLTEVALAADIGSVTRLTDTSGTPRFGLATPKSLTVVEIDNGFDDGVIVLEGFG